MRAGGWVADRHGRFHGACTQVTGQLRLVNPMKIRHFRHFWLLSFGLAPLGGAEHTECLRNVHPRAGGGSRTVDCLPYAPRPVPC